MMVIFYLVYAALYKVGATIIVCMLHAFYMQTGTYHVTFLNIKLPISTHHHSMFSCKGLLSLLVPSTAND